MSIARFPRDKRPTPAEWQARYTGRYRRKLIRWMPVILGVPLIALVAGLAWSYRVRGGLEAVHVMYGLVVYVVVAFSGWLLFIEIDRPRRNEGEITRRVLDASGYRDRQIKEWRC